MAGEREPVGRSIDVLIWLVTHPKPPWSVRHVARELHTSPTTIHRVFGIFEGRGLLEKDGVGGYVPGLELYRIGHSVASHMSPVRVVRPYLEALSRRCGETVMLGAYDPGRGEMMYLDMVQSAHPIRYVLEVNEWMPIHAGATGLAIFASLPEQDRKATYSRGLMPLTNRTLINEDELEDAVVRLKRDGYIWTRGQRQVGAVGIAAPVFDSADEVFGDVCVTIPDQRVEEPMLDEIGLQVLETSNAVTAELRRLGYRRGLADSAPQSAAPGG
jgi:IclR family transcriptional regulator, acetate operon repressor